VEREAAAGPAAASISPAPRAPSGDGPLLHHIGLYAYRRAALERSSRCRRRRSERREKLEQLRALTAGMRIDIAHRRHRAARRRHPG
jgi:3-deoxy-manno-octulosonate cytidylyltransferase (CMP-KDO synthetase)